jgi:SET domain-containing protein
VAARGTVFAGEPIPAGCIIAEYVGEAVRPIVSDLRERDYLSRGIGTYFFRIGKEEILDATFKGGVARYINHSCDPNAMTKTVLHDVSVGEGGEARQACNV